MSIKRFEPSESQLVLYQGNFLENEFKRSKDALIDQFFRKALFSYPLQQIEWKKLVNLSILHNSLPLKSFRALFPKLAKNSEPKEIPNLIFALFRHFAEYPSEEICSRFYWSYLWPTHKGGYDTPFKGKQCFLDNSICMVTCDALMASIFGPNYSGKLKNLSFDALKEGCNLASAWSTIEHNSKALSPSTFFTYSFGMQSSYSSFPGHVYLVVQYLNKDGSVQYHIFQSFVRQYSLKEYLKKDKNKLNHEEFKTFIKGLEECIMGDTWTASLEIFYTSYFNAKKGFSIGNRNPCKGQFNLYWGSGTIDDILEQCAKFETYQDSPDFPKIEAEHV